MKGCQEESQGSPRAVVPEEKEEEDYQANFYCSVEEKIPKFIGADGNLQQQLPNLWGFVQKVFVLSSVGLLG